MAKKNVEKTVDILIGSPREEFWRTVQVILQGYYPYKFRWVKSAAEILETPTEDFNPVLSLIDGQDGTVNANEWTQSTKMTFAGGKIIVLHNGRDLLDFEQVKKNGADEIMHINYDREFIADMVLALAPVDLDGDVPVSALLAVDTRDFADDTELNFDLYIHLPGNQKTIKYRHQGTTIQTKDLGKFEESKTNMYVKKTQTKQFFEYARTMASLKDMETPVSITEKLNKSKKTIYEIMSQFMNGTKSDYEAGRTVLEKCKVILQEFDFARDLPGNELFKELFRFTGNPRSYYSDAINMAAYCAFFAQAMDFPAPKREDAALVGLLHNIGLAQLPSSCIGKSMTEMTPEELEEYHLYPDRSVIMVKGKKVPLNPEVSDGILMHRERGDRTGFPKGIETEKIAQMGKIAGLAYMFMEATSLEKNTRAYTPEAALEYFRNQAFNNNPNFDILITTTIVKRLLQGG